VDEKLRLNQRVIGKAGIFIMSDAQQAVVPDIRLNQPALPRKAMQ
jgi:hypothetical protein